MMRHVTAVAIHRRRHLGNTCLFECTTVTLRLADVGELEARGRRKAKTIRLWHQTSRVADRCHFDAGLRTVNERVEHFRIDRLAIGNVQIFVEDVPDIVRIGLVIMRLIARALAGANHLKAGRARPINMLANESGVIPPGERIDNPGRLGAARQQRPRQRIGFDVDHDNMLAVGDGAKCVMNSRAWHASRLNNDFDLWIGDQSSRIVGDKSRSLLMRIGKRCGTEQFIRPSRALELAARARNVEIGYAGKVHASRQPHLRHEHGTELTSTNKAYSHRPAVRLPFDELGMKVHARNGNTGPTATQAPLELLQRYYWQRARETKVSVVHSGPVDRPDM